MHKHPDSFLEKRHFRTKLRDHIVPFRIVCYARSLYRQIDSATFYTFGFFMKFK